MVDTEKIEKEEESNEEKLKKIFEYFQASNIELPIAVKNSIQDVFDENDSVSTVDVYFKEDYDSLLDDISFKDEINIDISGKSSGEVNSVYTYYGDITFEENREISLVSGDEVLEVLENIQSPFNSNDGPCNVSINNLDDFCVVLIETITWETPTEQESRDPKLIIYCPEEAEEDDD